MTDLDKARELAEKLGYIPRPPDSVPQLTARYEQHFRQRGLPAAEARSRAELWAQLKQDMPEGSVIDPDLSVDDLLMQRSMQRSGMDPSSVRIDARQSIYAVEASTAGGPPSASEPPRSYSSRR